MKIVAGLIVYATFAAMGLTAALWIINSDHWRHAAASVCIIVGAGWPLAVVMAGANQTRSAK